MDRRIVKYQQETLKALSGKVDDFYLAGGTALSLFYFQHRISVDLDFFTHDFAYTKITDIAVYLEKVLKKKVILTGHSLKAKTAKMAVYNVRFTARDALKIDFVEDVVKLLKDTRTVDGIRILSLEDIYLRKLYALTGMIKIPDETGRDKFIGGRADAKDFYDVYFLSHTFSSLSKFVVKYCDRTMIEAIVRWFRTFDRMTMMDGVLSLITNKVMDYKLMERHFKKEIGRIIDYEIGGI